MSQEQKFISKSSSQKKSFSELFEFSTLQYYTLPSIYILVFTISKLHQNYWIGIWIIYTLIPLCDEMFPIDLKNPSQEEQKKLEGQLKFKLPLYTCIFLDWFNLFYTLNYLLTGPEITYLNLFAFLVLNGNLAASNINISHELIHKDDILDQIIGTITLWRNMYLHFAIEHIYGHHKHVATPMDPASSRKGQSVYQFLPQTVIGSYTSAWKIEKNRCQLKYKNQYSLNNMMIWYTASYMILPLVFLYYYGFVGMIYFLFTVFNGILYLEVVNYIEHYGLSRKEISPGVYEQVNITHSWNAPHRLSNYLLFKLQRHSDHHENAYKPYQTLCTYEKSPQLPHGYTVCIIAALNPKLWMSIMDECIESYQKNGKYVYNEKVLYSRLEQQLHRQPHLDFYELLMNQIAFYYGSHFFYIILYLFLDKPLIAIWILFCLIPLIDEFIKKDCSVPTEKEMKENENKFSFKLPLYTFIALDWLAMLFTLHYLVSSNPGIFNTIILIYILGGFGSMNLTVAHELLHKDNKLDKFLGTYSMIKNLYQHYSLEHVFGHHRHVGTPLDAVSASKGMPFDKFFIPAVKNQYKQAWTHEQNLPILQQKMFWYSIQQIIMLLIIFLFFGFLGTLYFILQAFISIRFLEVANYVEHYGLRRKELSPGQYEAIQPRHSWNSSYSIVNYILFKLQRHSDHHIHPFREYQNLIIDPEYPLLPCSYLTAFNLANFSNAWFDVMDNLIENKEYFPQAVKKVRNFQLKQNLILTLLGLSQLLI